MGENNEFYIDKSAAVLEVLHATMGEENFRNCIGAFINTYKYMTSEPNDLWQICSKKSNGSKNIKEIMLVWTSQAGFPLISVKKFNTTIIIEQSIFKMSELTAVYQDSSFDDDMNNTTDKSTHSTTTMASTTTTTLSPKELKKRSNKWIFPVHYITNNKDIKGSLFFDTFEGKFKTYLNIY